MRKLFINKWQRRLSGLCVCFILVFTGCEKVEYPPVVVGGTISFSQHIQPFFSEKCISCHSGSLAPDLTEGNSYDALINGGYIESDTSKAAESLLYTKLLGSHSSRALDSEKQKVLLWIKQGTQDN